MNDCPINQDGEFILYWMTSCRRFDFNASLQHAVTLSNQLKKPVLVVEAVSITHKFANDRILSFMIQGIMDNIDDFKQNSVSYIPWVEIKQKAGGKMLRSLSKKSACVTVSYTHLTLPTILRV